MTFLVIVLIANLLLGCVLLTIGMFRAEAERDSLRQRYGGIADVEAAKLEVEREVNRITNRRDELQSFLVREEGWAEQQDFGIYEPQYEFSEDQEYEQRLKTLRQQQHGMAESGAAVTYHGKKRDKTPPELKRDYMKLMLRAFNGQAEAAIATVTASTISDKLDRLDKLFAGINELGRTAHLQLEPAYLELKKDELRLVHDRASHKGGQRELGTDDEREDRVRAREFADAQRLLVLNRTAVQELEEKIEAATEEDRDRLQKQLDEAKTALASSTRAVTQAQPPRSGYVYILSNVGSFGEDVYSIGVTRRLVPQKRVLELSGASVPFPFDVHAMIYSADALALKHALQEALEDYRINRVNTRKDFFRVNLDQLALVLEEHEVGEPLLMEAAAREYHESIEKGGAAQRQAG